MADLHRLLRRIAAACALALAGCAAAPGSAPPPAQGNAPVAASAAANAALPAPAGGAAPATAAEMAEKWYAARGALGATGALRVGVYPGSPTSFVYDSKAGQPAGVAHDLGIALGRELGMPVRVITFDRLALVLDALKAGQVDFTFTNATESRAKDVDFTPTVLQLELGYLVPAGSKLATMADVDQPGVRIGVSQGSSSQGTLPRVLKSATLVPAASLQVAQETLQSGQVQAFATNKGILYELADALPGSRVMDGRWGVESMAIAIPKGRDTALPYLTHFVQHARSSGQLKAIIARAGVRGTVAD